MVFLESVYQYLSLISTYKLPVVEVTLLWLSWRLIRRSPCGSWTVIVGFPLCFSCWCISGFHTLPAGVQPLWLRVCEWEGDEEQSGHNRELHPPALHLPVNRHRLGTQTAPADWDLRHGAEPDQRMEGPRGPQQEVRSRGVGGSVGLWLLEPGLGGRQTAPNRDTPCDIIRRIG